MSDKKLWGGHRQGAGRPTKLLNPKRVTIWLEVEQLKWLDSQEDRSEAIRELIQEKINDQTRTF